MAFFLQSPNHGLLVGNALISLLLLSRGSTLSTSLRSQLLISEDLLSLSSLGYRFSAWNRELNSDSILTILTCLSHRV